MSRYSKQRAFSPEQVEHLKLVNKILAEAKHFPNGAIPFFATPDFQRTAVEKHWSPPWDHLPAIIEWLRARFNLPAPDPMAAKTPAPKKPAATKAAPAATKAAPAKRAGKKAAAELPPLEERVPELADIDPRHLRLDGGTQFRVDSTKETVDHYADRTEAGDVFPPVKVVVEKVGDEAHYWLYDGFSRTRAKLKIGHTSMKMEWIPGTKRDAIYLALAANKTNGLQRTNADKRNAARVMLEDPEWNHMTNRQLAGHLGVSDPFIGKIRGEIKAEQDSSRPQQTELAGMPGATSPRKQAEDAWDKEQASTRTGADGVSGAYPGAKESDVPPTPSTPAADSTDYHASRDGGDEPPVEERDERDEHEAEPLGAHQPQEPTATPPRAPGAGSTAAPPAPSPKPKPDNRDSDQRMRDAKDWIAARDKIALVLGDDMACALADGRVNLTEKDVIFYGGLADEELKRASDAILQNWPFVKFQRIHQGIINGDSKLAELVNKAIAEGGSFELELNGIIITAHKKED